MLCGRRKMMMMIPVFAVVLLWAHVRRRRGARPGPLIGILVISGVLGYAFYQEVGRDPNVDTYYFVDTGDVFDRIRVHAYRDVVGTYRRYGFFGAGLGTATQGTHHLRVARPYTYQEGGLGRLLVELGVFGFVCMVVLFLALFVSAAKLLARRDLEPRDFAMLAGLGAIFMANAASFVISHQIFGDPFVNCFFSLMIGFLLSGVRFVRGTAPAGGRPLPWQRRSEAARPGAVPVPLDARRPQRGHGFLPRGLANP